MKKLVLAAAIAAVAGNVMAFEAYNADGTAVTISGEVRTKLSKESGEKTEFEMGGSSAKFAISHELTEDLTVSGLMKFAADVNDSNEELSVDDGYLSLSSNTYGTVTIGQVGSAYDNLMGGFDASVNFGGAATLGATENGGGSYNSAANYTWSNDSLTVVASYSKEEGELDSAYSLGASWASDFGLTLVGAYGTAEMNDESSNILGFEADYSYGAWTVGAAFSKTDTDKTGIGTGVSYSFLESGTAYAGYNVVDNDGSDTKTFNMGAEYYVHPQVKVFADFATEESTDQYALGARVYF